MRFANEDLKKDIQKLLFRHRWGLIRAKSKNADKNLVEDIEDLFEKWYDMRISACLV